MSLHILLDDREFVSRTNITSIISNLGIKVKKVHKVITIHPYSVHLPGRFNNKLFDENLDLYCL